MAATPPADDGPVLWLRSVRDCRLHDLRAPATETLVRLSGPATARVRLAGKAPTHRRVVVDADVDTTALQTEES